MVADWSLAFIVVVKKTFPGSQGESLTSDFSFFAG
jgi:hypothetical protein